MRNVSSPPVLRSEKGTNVRFKTTLAAVRVGMRVADALPGDLAAAWSERLFTSPRRHERPERELAWLAQARPFRLPVAGQSLRAWRWGEGPPVLLVHGWEGRGAQLGALVEPLVARGHSVVTFDGPAHGDSPGRSVVLADFARTIGAAGRAVGPLHGLVAHSFGAASSTVALSQGLEVERVVYLAPAALLNGATSRFARMVGISPGVRRQLEARLERRNGFRIADANGSVLARRMRARLLLVHDEADPEVPLAEGRLISDAWPGAQLLVTHGLGHQKILWAPAIASAVTEFLTAG